MLVESASSRHGLAPERPEVSPSGQSPQSRLTAAANLAEAAAPWLACQCSRIPDVCVGMVFQSGIALAVWPDIGADGVAAGYPALSAAAERACDRNHGVVSRAGLQSGWGMVIAWPVGLAPDNAEGAAVFALAAEADDAVLRKAMEEVRWGTAWLREVLLRDRSIAAMRAQAVLDLFATGLEEERFKSAARKLATGIAAMLGCDRVSIGYRTQAQTSRIAGISRSAKINRRMNLVRRIEEAMDESVDQQAVILYPPAPGDIHITCRHKDLADSRKASAIATAPMRVRDSWFGAITCERTDGHLFTASEVADIESFATVTGPLLAEKRRNDRWIVVKIAESATLQLQRLLGPAHYKRKLAVGLFAGVVLAGALTTWPYSVVADASVEGRIQRIIAAPLNGVLKSAPARAGDRVRAGQPMAIFDDRDFVLERQQWVTERQAHLYSYEQAFGSDQRAEARIAQVRAEQAETRIKHVDSLLARATVRAPINGLVVSGDLSQKIGTAVHRGEVLFELAPLTEFRVLLLVHETQIREVNEGIRGRLKVLSLPDRIFPVAVEQVLPIAAVQEGANYFRVEASVEGGAEVLRPGMTGIARLDVDDRLLVWIWTRTFLDWLNLVTWRWFG